jgi:hypothetical protein
MPLWAALCWSLLLTRARRRGPVWCAAVLLMLMAGQELPRQQAAGAVAEPGSGLLEAAAPAEAGTRERSSPPYAVVSVTWPVLAVARPRVRSLQCRELPPARAPDRGC